ncbi:MAG: peptidase C69, partial [Prevotella sp.]|nr:peptidase C69 [Prevotella sp.]
DGDKRIKFLTDYSCQKGDEMIDCWRQLAFHLIVKYNDCAVKPTDKNGQFQRNQYGGGARIQRPGMPEAYARQLIELTGDKFMVPAEEKK